MKHGIIVAVFALVVFTSMVSAVSIKDVTSSPIEVAPGDVVSVSIEIENIFDYDVTNLNVELDLSNEIEEIPFAPYQSSSEKFLDELEEGKEKDFTFKLIALPSAKSGIYKIPVKITYKDDDGDVQTKQGLISLTVNAEPELKVSAEDSPLIRGREAELSIRIINSGLSDVKFVYLIVNDVAGIKIISSKEQYIGDVDSDDFDSAEYKIIVDENSQSTINLPVILKFKDATNKEFTESITLTLKTYSLKEAQKLGLVQKPNYMWYGLGAGLVLTYLIYRWRKKRKLKRKG